MKKQNNNWLPTTRKFVRILQYLHHLHAHHTRSLIVLLLSFISSKNLLSDSLFIMWLIWSRIRSVEHGICPIAAVCTVVEILIFKCFWSRPWPFKVTWRHRSREHSTTVWFFIWWLIELLNDTSNVHQKREQVDCTKRHHYVLVMTWMKIL